MPSLDVSEVLNSPEFIDTTLVCTRQVQTVGDDGLALNTTTTIPFSGVVTREPGDILERLAGGSIIKGTIRIHTTFVLDDGGPGKSADIVTWQTRQYTVTDVDDYSTWGAGFVSARCEVLALSGG